jgi:hypothetical protein
VAARNIIIYGGAIVFIMYLWLGVLPHITVNLPGWLAPVYGWLPVVAIIALGYLIADELAHAFSKEEASAPELSEPAMPKLNDTAVSHNRDDLSDPFVQATRALLARGVGFEAKIEGNKSFDLYGFKVTITPSQDTLKFSLVDSETENRIRNIVREELQALLARTTKPSQRQESAEFVPLPSAEEEQQKLVKGEG